MTFFATRRRLVEEANKRLRLPIPDFALTDRKKIIDRLMQEPEILSYIEETAIAENTSTDALLKKARMYAAEIGPKFSPFFYFRFAYFLARGWLRLHFRVQALAADEPGFDAIKPDSTVIFVSNHRSNFDPLLITYMASRRSTVALSAGEWARLWPLHHFVRAAGGFVVDRDDGSEFEADLVQHDRRQSGGCEREAERGRAGLQPEHRRCFHLRSRQRRTEGADLLAHCGPGRHRE